MRPPAQPQWKLGHGQNDPKHSGKSTKEGRKSRRCNGCVVLSMSLCSYSKPATKSS